MPSIDFTDAMGAASLASSFPAPADRFANWLPGSRPIGEAANALGDGRLYRFQFRKDHTASFEIPGIPNTGLDIALRLQDHLLGGGSVSVTTDDQFANVYTECGLAPDTEPTIEFSDRQTLEYTFHVTLLNIEALPAPLLVIYS